MKNEFEENYSESSSKDEQIVSDGKINDGHAKSDRIEEIRRIVDQVLDELVTKAVAACNQEVGAGDVDNDRKRLYNKKFIEHVERRKRVEDWVNSQNELHQLYQNNKVTELSSNYKITRSINEHNHPFIMWELDSPRYSMVKVVKIGSKEKIVYSNGILDNAEVKRIVEASEKMLNKKKGLFSRLRKAFRKICCFSVRNNE